MTPSKESAARDIYAISRIQARRGIWCWTVMFSRAGRVYYKSFYDVRRGGPEKALADAIVWRDQQLLAIKAMTMREFCQIKRTSNSSGAPGVQLIWPKNQPLGCWQARVKFPDGRTAAKTYSVQKYGEAQAFALAKEARERLLETVDDKPFLHHPEARMFAALSYGASRSCLPPGDTDCSKTPADIDQGASPVIIAPPSFALDVSKR